MHSIRAITQLLPAWAATSAWATLSLAVCIRAIRTWRTDLPVAVRLAVVVLASVLVNPHLTVYDATVLVLPFLWLGARVEDNAESDPTFRTLYWSLVYWLSLAFLVPLAYIVKVQCSVLLMLLMFYPSIESLAASSRANLIVS